MGLNRDKPCRPALLCVFTLRCFADLVTESGYIRKCYDNVIEGVTVSDLLHDMLLNPDSDNLEVYSDEEKQEFLYDLFKSVVTGGSMCQFEDSWDPYLTAVKVRPCLCASCCCSRSCCEFASLSVRGRVCVCGSVMERQVLTCCARVCCCATQTIYKQLLSVHKNEAGKLVISSVVLKLKSIDADTALFPSDSPYHTCYVVVDPLKRAVTVFYNAFVHFW